MEFLKVTVFFYNSTGELKCKSNDFTLSAAVTQCSVLASLVASGVISSFHVDTLNHD